MKEHNTMIKKTNGSWMIQSVIQCCMYSANRPNILIYQNETKYRQFVIFQNTRSFLYECIARVVPV